MSIREFIKNNADVKITKEISKNLEISGVVHSTGDEMILFNNVKESKNSVAVNVFASKEKVAKYLDCEIKDLVPKMINALENPKGVGMKPDLYAKLNAIGTDAENFNGEWK